MSMTETPRSERVHIALFGNRNSGKSSLVNAITGQSLAIVSPEKGTTTDPVYKSIEILPLGPCVLIDTAGLDDTGALGALRVEKSMEVLQKCDIAIIVVDATRGVTAEEELLAARLRERSCPVIAAVNKIDAVVDSEAAVGRVALALGCPTVAVSAAQAVGITALKEALAKLLPEATTREYLLGEMVAEGDVAVLVCPIDSAAPKGRMILPQQQVIRELIERGCGALVCVPEALKGMLESLKTPPKLVITDSQVFREVAAIVPAELPLTGFSIIFAAYKGDLAEFTAAAQRVMALENGDRILIAEGCSHHRQKDDIGTVKIPRWLGEMTGKELKIEHYSGADFPADLDEYKLIIHCGACMLTKRAMSARIDAVRSARVPIINYGVFIALRMGILDRVLEPFNSRGN